ncbi:MAG: hypothetical protein FWC21_00645 [Treponema sp.]|nr:hypothetical protein [Treponema sp.]
MPQEENRIAGFQITKRSLITILICVAVSALFMRTGFLTMFFLIPLGYAVFSSGSFMFTFILAAAANAVFYFISLFAVSGSDFSFINILIDISYLTALMFLFTWVTGGKNIRTAYRIIIASSVSAVFLIIMINRLDSLFYTYSMEAARELMPGLITEETIEIARNILLRGGALVSMFSMFFINRQIASGVFWLVKKQRKDRGLVSFYAPLNTIWVFSGSLATIILAGKFGIEIIEIIAWNIFVICVIIFLAQGIGILSHLLSGKSPVFRMCSTVCIVILLLSPLTVIALAAIIILGIIEIWRPLRRGADSVTG